MSARLAEVAEALAARGQMVCVPTVEEEEGGVVVLTVRVDPGRQPTVHLAANVPAALLHELQYVCDIATMRALCERHGIPSGPLEAALPQRS